VNQADGAEGSTGTLLIVDDDEDARLLLRRMLERRGFSVLLADGGRAALKVVAGADVDVILLDVMMPIMDGFEVCRELQKSPSWAKIPVILLTARDDIETRAMGMNLGVSEFLAKPVNKEQLFRRVQTQVDARRRGRKLERIQRRADLIG
jgi:DNA-binding response OmpR family regulator